MKTLYTDTLPILIPMLIMIASTFICPPIIHIFVVVGCISSIFLVFKWFDRKEDEEKKENKYHGRNS